jgi:hypothetical protein
MDSRVAIRKIKNVLTIAETENDTMDFDTIICGAGVAGVPAAVAAARNGARVLLIERYGFSGGMATAGLVNPWAGHIFHNPESGAFGSLIRGCFEEFALRLYRLGGYGSSLTQSAFDDELLKYVYDQVLKESGVTVRYHTFVIGSVMEGTRITAVVTQSKQGQELFRARHFIDATGDGDLAAAAGCSFSIGRESDGKTQALTTKFRIGGVDKKAFQGLPGHRAARSLVEPYFQDAKKTGRLDFPFRDFIHFYDFPRPGVLHFNMTRITDADPLQTADLSRAEIEGRRQAFLLTSWLKKEVPFFSQCYIEKLPCQVGIRESRHIRGRYTMTAEDIVSARKFSDGIVRSRYFIDIHNPIGSGFLHEVPGTRGLVASSFQPPKNDWYEVSYRAMVPDSIENLLVACRALSATHEAAAAIRVMATMTGLGEAAGIAAAIALRENKQLCEVDGRSVRSILPYLNEPPVYSEPWCYDIQNDAFAV